MFCAFFCFWAQNATKSDDVKHASVFDPIAQSTGRGTGPCLKSSCSQNSNSLPDMTSSLPDQHQQVDRICVLIHPTGYRRARTLRSITSLLLGLQACVLLSTVSFCSEPSPALSVCPRFGHFVKNMRKGQTSNKRLFAYMNQMTSKRITCLPSCSHF